jgi:hypothetical protein
VGFTVLDAGEGEYAEYIRPSVETYFDSAREFIEAVRRRGGTKAPHIANRNCLRLDSARATIEPVAAAKKVQKTLHLSEEQAVLLDAAAGVEGKDQAEIVEEALRLRVALMGEDYARLLESVVALRRSDDPVRRLHAAEALRDDVLRAAGGAMSVQTALDRVRARSTAAT